MINNASVWVFPEHQGVFLAGRGWPHASQVCCDRRHTNHTKFPIWSCYDQLGVHVWSRLCLVWNHTHVWPRLWSAWSHEWSRLWLICYHKWTRLWLAQNQWWTRLWPACTPRIMLYVQWQRMISLFLYGRSTRGNYSPTCNPVGAFISWKKRKEAPWLGNMTHWLFQTFRTQIFTYSLLKFAKHYKCFFDEVMIPG